MKAQAQAAPIIQKPVHDPLPPVIVKIGGGENPPPNAVPVLIDSRPEWTVMARINKAVTTWTKAGTVRTGRIYGFTVQDPNRSNPVVCKIDPQADVLTTLNFYFASTEDALKVSEVPDENRSIHLEAQSNSLFKADDPMGEGRWKNSAATFSSRLVKLEVSLRKIGSDDDFVSFEYLIDSEIVDLNLDYREILG